MIGFALAMCAEIAALGLFLCALGLWCLIGGGMI